MLCLDSGRIHAVDRLVSGEQVEEECDTPGSKGRQGVAKGG